MRLILARKRVRLSSGDGSCHLRQMASWLVLTCMLTLLAVMPWTEYYCDWDMFLHGGPDLELGLLAIGIMLCFVLLVTQDRRRAVHLLLTLWEFCRFPHGRSALQEEHAGRVIAHSHYARNLGAVGADLDLWGLPLQI